MSTAAIESTVTCGKTCAELGYHGITTADIEAELRTAETELEVAMGRMHQATGRIAAATRKLREIREDEDA